MSIIEYAENLFKLAHSQEMTDFISKLDNKEVKEDDWFMRVNKLQNYYFFVFYRSTEQYFIVSPMMRTNNTTDFVYINEDNVLILSQHLLSKYRKRVMPKSLHYNLRGSFKEVLEHSIQTILNINKEIFLATIGMSDKYNDNYFAWTKFGLMPIERYSDIVFCGTTFISVDILNEKQKDLWQRIHKRLLESNLLGGMG